MVTRLLEQRFTIKPYSPVIKLPALSFLEKQWKKPWSPTSHQGPQADILKALGGAAQAGGRGQGAPWLSPGGWVAEPGMRSPGKPGTPSLVAGPHSPVDLDAEEGASERFFFQRGGRNREGRLGCWQPWPGLRIGGHPRKWEESPPN